MLWLGLLGCCCLLLLFVVIACFHVVMACFHVFLGNGLGRVLLLTGTYSTGPYKTYFTARAVLRTLWDGEFRDSVVVGAA